MSDEDSPSRDRTGKNDDTIRIRYDWNTTSPSIAVAETVSMAAGSEPNEIEPLYTHIDPESLDELIFPNHESRCEATDSISFSYDVTVRGNGEVSVQKNGSV